MNADTLTLVGKKRLRELLAMEQELKAARGVIILAKQFLNSKLQSDADHLEIALSKLDYVLVRNLWK